jgi:hypothetical protein
MDDQWIQRGAEDDDARGQTVPAFIEVQPGEFKPIEECEASELYAAGQSKLLQVRALMEESNVLLDLAYKRMNEERDDS